MKQVEIRRHSVRDPPQEHLSARGRALAREVGSRRGPFRRVISSPATRAVETAEAMGFPPQATTPLWSDLGGGAIPWPLTFEEYAREVRVNPVASRLAGQLAESIALLAAGLDEGDQALIVTHGGFPELATATRVPPAELVGLGPACRCMEGVLFRFRGADVLGVEPLRLTGGRTRL
jgi:hypothetical protein